MISPKNPQLWLLGIGSSLMAIYLTITWRNNTTEVLFLNFIFLVFICSILKEKRHTLNLESGVFASCLGLLLIILVFMASIFDKSFAGLFFLSPLLSGCGVACLASGFSGLKQYKIELIGLFFLSAHRFCSVVFKDISLITAKFSHLLLWYTGFNVSRSGVQIQLPTGSILVNSDCAGMALILNLVGLAILFILIFNLNWWQRIIVPTVGAILGFVINGIRVAIMAILVSQGDQNAFEYWHFGDGSLIFSMVSSLIFGSFCWVLLSINQQKNLTTSELSK